MFAKGFICLVICEVFLIGSGPVALVLPILMISGNRARLVPEGYIPDANQIPVLVTLAGFLLTIIIASRLVQHYKPSIVNWCLARVPEIDRDRKKIQLESRLMANLLMVVVVVSVLTVLGNPAISIGLSTFAGYVLGLIFFRFKFFSEEPSILPSPGAEVDGPEHVSAERARSKPAILPMLGAMQDALLICALVVLLFLRLEEAETISSLVITFVLVRYELRFLHAAGVSSIKYSWAHEAGQ